MSRSVEAMRSEFSRDHRWKKSLPDSSWERGLPVADDRRETLGGLNSANGS